MNTELRNELTIEKYESYLRFGTEDGRHESHIPGEFIKDEDGRIWFTSGGNCCVGTALCEWHGGQTCPVYACGSSTIANRGVPCEIVEEAIDRLQSTRRDIKKGTEDEYDIAELEWLIELLSCAVVAEPGANIQYVYGE